MNVQLNAVFVDGKKKQGWLEMPLYTGGDLWQWCEAEPRSSADKLSVLRHALVGLEHVHRCGIVHADVKPGELLVS